MVAAVSAAAAVRAAVRQALSGIAGLGVHDVRPVQASLPHAQVDIGPETDCGHKSGAGRELRIAVAVRDRGERADGVEALAASVETAVGAMEVGLPWRVASLVFVRTRMVREAAGWAASVEFRVRVLGV